MSVDNTALCGPAGCAARRKIQAKFALRSTKNEACQWFRGTRKGAVSAKAGQLGIIPGSMGARSYIDAVMDAQRDLADVVHTLKQVVCVKG